MTYISDMKKLIFIDACMRAGSRTRRIATPIIAELGKRYSVETVDLTRNIYPVADNYTLEDRNQGVVPAEDVDLAKRIAAAVRIENQKVGSLARVLLLNQYGCVSSHYSFNSMQR